VVQLAPSDQFLLSLGQARATAAFDRPTRKSLNPDLTRAFEVANDDPMMASVAGRYASALYDLATEQNQVKPVEQAMKQLQSLLDISSDLLSMVRSPVISAEEQGTALAAVMEKAGVGGLAANFVKLIAKNRRLFAIADMIKNYHTLVARGRGEMGRGDLGRRARRRAAQHLKDTLKASVGKDVSVTSRVDQGLLGGLIVKVGSRMIDSSLRTKLNNLKIAMKEVG
jgi:F-type H+-transporting ATPase subunit delta